MEKRKSVSQKGILGMLWTFSGSIVKILLQFIVIGILARLLTPQEFGIVAVMMILVNFSDLFTQMGIGSALIQLQRLTPKHISTGYSLSLIIGLTIGGLFYFVAPHVATFFELENVDDAIRFFSIFFPINSLGSVSTSLLSRKFKFPILVKVGAISYLLGIGLTSIVLAILGFGFWSLILGQFASLVIGTSSKMYFERPSFSFSFPKKIVNEILFYGSGHTLGTIFNYFAENADNIVVGKYLGTIALGIYSKAFQLLAIPAKFFGSIFDKVLFPILSLKQNEIKKLSNFYLFSHSICFGLLMPIAVLIFINAQLIVDIVLGNQWDKVVFPLQILIIGLAFRFGSKINKSYLKSMGLVYKSAFYQLIFAVMMGSFCFIGGLWFGLYGVAFGVLMATIGNYVQMSYRLYKELEFLGQSFFLIHLKSLIFNMPFLILTLILKNYYEIESKWVHLGLTLAFYLPLMTFFFLSKKNIIFNEQNFPLLSQVLNSFPTSINKVTKKVSFLKKYYEL